jgi:hypothetical protein
MMKGERKMAKHFVMVTIGFAVETDASNKSVWRNTFKRHLIDLTKVINANPFFGKMFRVDLAYDGGAPHKIKTDATGAPTANVVQVFTRCKDCKNPSYCTTQGWCSVAERVRLSETRFPDVLAASLVKHVPKMQPDLAADVVRSALKEALFEKYSKEGKSDVQA